MITIQNYTTLDGLECVIWTDEQGTHSMLKSVYDEQQAAQAQPLG
jgi:hypothetical protein